MRANEASKTIDYPRFPTGENKRAWDLSPLARVSSQVPFFRVFEGERRFDGFPFGLHRNGPKRAVFGALSDGASNRPV